jgi:hypothetical protein
VADLIERKFAGPEQAALLDSEVSVHQREYERLRVELEASYQVSRLPEGTAAHSALNDLLVLLRMQNEGRLRQWSRRCHRCGADLVRKSVDQEATRPDLRFASVPGVSVAVTDTGSDGNTDRCREPARVIS